MCFTFSSLFSQIKLNRGSDLVDKELVKSAISIRMAAYSCSEPTLVNVSAEGLRAGQEAQLSWVKCAWLYRLHLLCWDGVCGPFCGAINQCITVTVSYFKETLEAQVQRQLLTAITQKAFLVILDSDRTPD